MAAPHAPDAPALFGYQLAQTPAQLYREAVAAIDETCRSQHGSSFAELAAETQDKTLVELQQGRFLSNGPVAREFFSMLLANTREGYLSDPMYGGNRGMVGWKWVGFPGARAAYLDWADVSDKPYPLGPVSIQGDRG